MRESIATLQRFFLVLLLVSAATLAGCLESHPPSDAQDPSDPQEPADESDAGPAQLEVHGGTYAYQPGPPPDDQFEVPDGFQQVGVTLRIGSCNVVDPFEYIVVVGSPTGEELTLRTHDKEPPELSCHPSVSGFLPGAAGTWTVSFDGLGDPQKSVQVQVLASK